jgi:hypothetical protein
MNQHQINNAHADILADWPNFSIQEGYCYWYRQLRQGCYGVQGGQNAPGYQQAYRVWSDANQVSEVRSLRLKTLATQARLRYWLNVDRFGKWLAGNPEDFVGIRADSRDCPIARYLKSLNPQFSNLWVGVELFGVPPSEDVDGLELTLPKWANKFIRIIDDQSAAKEIYKETAIAALTAAAQED